MKLCNENVTLYNERYDKEADCSIYVPTVLKGVHMFNTMKSTVDSKGLKSADTITVRIPASVDASGKAYTDPQSYAEAEDASELFTLNEGDLIVPGEAVFTAPAPANLHKIQGCMTILGVTDNRRAPHAPHWKVSGA